MALTGRLVVIKVGGDVVQSDVAGALSADIGELERRGERVCLVHGGGPQTNALQRALGQTPNVRGGRRITDEPALEAFKMAVAGKVNVELCAALLGAGAHPVGLHGASSCAVRGRKRPPRIVSGCGPDPVDFGFVGDVTGINRQLFDGLWAGGFVPVVACLAADEAGGVYNINADAVANAVAAELGASDLVAVTGAQGVLRDIADPDSRIPSLDEAGARANIESGIIQGGMIPKVEEALRGLRSGIGRIHIMRVDGKGDLVRELDRPGSIGTEIRL